MSGCVCPYCLVLEGRAHLEVSLKAVRSHAERSLPYPSVGNEDIKATFLLGKLLRPAIDLPELHHVQLVILDGALGAAFSEHLVQLLLRALAMLWVGRDEVNLSVMLCECGYIVEADAGGASSDQCDATGEVGNLVRSEALTEKSGGVECVGYNGRHGAMRVYNGCDETEACEWQTCPEAEDEHL